MKKIIIIVLGTFFLFSCGGKKRVVSSSKKQPIIRKVTPKKTTTVTQTEKKVSPKPPATTTKRPANSYTDKVQNYIFEFSEIAKNEMKVYGIPASITLAQGILESGAGYGELTQKAKNHFGIKCHDWTGPKVYHDDDRSQECFRKYKKASESFRDHSLFLKNRKRYAKLFTFRQEDYKSWAKGLREAGYATDKKYPEKLISIIERYGLSDYDREVLGKKPKTIAKKEKTKPVISAPVQPSTPITGDSHVVQQGDTLYSISKKYHISVDELRRFNNLSDNNISIGQVLKTTLQQEIEEEEEEDFN